MPVHRKKDGFTVCTKVGIIVHYGEQNRKGEERGDVALRSLIYGCWVDICRIVCYGYVSHLPGLMQKEVAEKTEKKTHVYEKMAGAMLANTLL